MSIIKQIKDRALKSLWGKDYVPRELLELHDYFRLHRVINFKYEHKKGLIIAISKDFLHGSIVTSGKDEIELDKNIKDAILTSFDLPSSYEKETKIYKKCNGQEKKYALA